MSRTRQRETEEQVSASVPELPQSSTGLDHDQLPSPSRMAGLSASVGGLNLLQLINAVGRDYGSAPPVQDSDQADELMAESETLAFTPKMLLERERELLGASSLHQAELSGIHQTDSKQDDEPAEDGHIDTLASSIHAIHRPLEHLTSTSREPASPEVSRSSPDKTIAVCHAPNLPHHYDEGCSDEPRSESESEHDDAFESGRPQRRRSQLTASRLRQLDETLGSSSQAHVHPERRGASAASSVEDVQQPQEGHHHVQRSMSRSERLAILAAKLQEIFGHSEQEEIVAEFQAFLFRSVLLQGFLYLTTGHICFYAYLRGQEGQILRSGSLSKQASKTPRYKQHWFVLRNDTLSWYPSAAEPYFPNGDVSLCYVTSVEPSRKNARRFKVHTANRRLVFMAESQAARNDWMKAINKAVFQRQTEGDSIKISIPLETVVSIDRTSLDFVDALTIRVSDSESGIEGDAYPFCYLSNMQAAFDRLRSLLADFKLRREHWTSQTSSQPGSQGPRVKGLATEALAPSPSTTPLAASRLALHRSNSTPSQESVTAQEAFVSPSPPKEATRKASIETIKRGNVFPDVETLQTSPIPIQKQPSLASNSSSHDHTYPPDTLSNSPDEPLSTTPSRNYMQWPVPDWLRSAPKLISAVTRPPTIGLDWPAAPARRIMEVLSSPTQPDRNLRTATREEAGPSKAQDDLQSIFLLPQEEQIDFSTNAYIYRGLPIYGRLYLTGNFICFRSTNLISGTKMILPLKDTIAAQKSRAYRFGYSGMVLIVKGHEELFFEVTDRKSRDTFRDLLEHHLELKRVEVTSPGMPFALQEAKTLEELQTPTAIFNEEQPEDHDVPAIMFKSNSSSFLDFKPKTSLHFVCLTIGSRGDVQPYIALCKGLIAEGHRCTIASHPEYRAWVESHGISYEDVGGDPAELMRICVDNGMFTVSFLKEGLSKFRGWLDELLQTSWKACQTADVLIESPSAMSGLHIAEALQIPYFRAFTMPWTRTRAYPHAFAVPESKMGGQYNYLSYTMFDSIFWRAIAGQINRWRRETLKLAATSADRMEQSKIPFLYNLSPSVMPPPLDWPEWVHVTGYWFLDKSDPTGKKDWCPPAALLQFMQKARHESKKLVYIGFGSIVVPDPEGLTRTVNEAIIQANVCAIVSKGWAGRLATDLRTDEERAAFNEQQRKEKEMLCDAVFTVDAIPHDWLFPRVDAACHHGGSGTTGASLKAGIPTIIKPFFGDQFFQADRMEALGVGSCLKKLNVESLATALRRATSDAKQIKRAQLLGQEIRKEDGVASAIEMIYRDLEYAKTLVKRRARRKKASTESQTSSNDPSRSISRESFHRVSSEDAPFDTLSEESWDHVSHTSDVLSRSGFGSPRSKSDDSDNNASSGEVISRSGRKSRSRSGSVLKLARSAGQRITAPFQPLP